MVELDCEDLEEWKDVFGVSEVEVRWLEEDLVMVRGGRDGRDFCEEELEVKLELMWEGLGLDLGLLMGVFLIFCNLLINW